MYIYNIKCYIVFSDPCIIICVYIHIYIYIRCRSHDICLLPVVSASGTSGYSGPTLILTKDIPVLALCLLASTTVASFNGVLA